MRSKAHVEHCFPDWAPSEVIAMWSSHKRDVEKRQAARAASTERDARGFALAKKEAAKGLRVAPAGMRLATLNEINEQERRAAERAKRCDARDAVEREILDLLKRLLTRTEMKPVWGALRNAGAYQGDITHSKMFTLVARRAWMGPREEEAWTSTERKKWLEDVDTLAEKLAGKLDRTGADHDFLWRNGIEGAAWGMSDLLRTLGRTAGWFLAPARLARPRDEFAKRAYFVRIMAEWCRASFDRPRVDLITPTALVALADDKITERQVYRLIEDKRRGDTKRLQKTRKRH